MTTESDEIDLKFFQANLGELIDELERQLSSAESSAKPVTLDQSKVGRLSRMDAIQQQQMALASRQATALRLERAKQALRRIEQGTFGECLDCGELIEDKRLRANPEVLLCLGCQSTRE